MHPVSVMRRLLLAACTIVSLQASAQTARDRAVEMRATIRQTRPRIALRWNPSAAGTLLEQHLYRRTDAQGAWLELANLPLTAVTYTDDAVAVGIRYEYFVQRLYDGAPGTADGWLSVGIRVPLVEDRGKVILLVDSTMAAPLAAELAQFTSDLIGDGWTVLRQDVPRDTTTPAEVRATVQGLHQADPANTRALILFGHIPVPYSGDFSADGHGDHLGAWPADTYYADIDGSWTDTLVNDTAATFLSNRNVPGDGKLDQSTLPSAVELAVGRIDLAGMPIFGLTETELLRQYLARDHQFRHRIAPYAAIPRRGLIDDHFGYFEGEAFAANGWRGFGALFGSANVRPLDWFGTLSKQSYLCAYGCGPGTYIAADGVGTTRDFADHPSLAVFNFLLGSYFGDWDNQDNFLRAPLGGPPGSLGLVSAWAGRPHWFLHPMGLGATIGECARVAQNNTGTFPAGYDAGIGVRGVHTALLGDPTLRLHPVRPPTRLVARPGANQIQLTWRGGGDSAVEGYLVLRALDAAGPFERLRGAFVRGASYIDRSATPGLTYTYLVRAAKREATNSGSYLNLSQGVFSEPATATAGAAAEANVVGNGRAITDGDTVPLAANGTDFGAVQIGQPALIHTFTIRNPGPVPLTIRSATLSGKQAADFVLEAVPASVAAGGSGAFTVSFQPTVVGPRSVRLLLRSDDPNESVFDFTLGGTAAPAP